jgi:hypothetical protein
LTALGRGSAPTAASAGAGRTSQPSELAANLDLCSSPTSCPSEPWDPSAAATLVGKEITGKPWQEHRRDLRPGSSQRTAIKVTGAEEAQALGVLLAQLGLLGDALLVVLDEWPVEVNRPGHYRGSHHVIGVVKRGSLPAPAEFDGFV